LNYKLFWVFDKKKNIKFKCLTLIFLYPPKPIRFIFGIINWINHQFPLSSIIVLFFHLFLFRLGVKISVSRKQLFRSPVFVFVKIASGPFLLSFVQNYLFIFFSIVLPFYLSNNSTFLSSKSYRIPFCCYNINFPILRNQKEHSSFLENWTRPCSVHRERTRSFPSLWEYTLGTVYININVY